MCAQYGVLNDRDYPDHSEYLWHLTGRPKPLVGFGDPTRDNALALKGRLHEPRSRLVSILTEDANPVIWGSFLHYMGQQYQKQQSPRCVCFTECIPNSLLQHSKRYSRWGLLFSKETLYRLNARPVWYVDAVLMNRFAECLYPYQRDYQKELSFPNEYLHLLMPFAPRYGKYRFGGVNRPDTTLDWMVEREWRIRDDFVFEYDNIAALIVPTENDMIQFREEFPRTAGIGFIVTEDLVGIEVEHKDFNCFIRSE